VTINATHQGIQEWSVPAGGTYRIEVFGARGGGALDSNFGNGAQIVGEILLGIDEKLKILVGQMGGHATSGSGGGGSFVVKVTGAEPSDINPLIIAGGGGGVWKNESDLYNSHASISTNGQGTSIPGGNNGNGGNGNTTNGASAGGGLFTNGTSGTYGTFGYSFIEGGAGGNTSSAVDCVGGFGGGGGTHGGTGGGGGGGGYSGGAGGWHDLNTGNGGGGGSYNSGTNQDNQTGVNDGHGKVIITYIGN
jgi:hypothetical protein